ncbi:hypothetical protein BJF92_11115 [Rhizobium rhizosphaerae]|uniref:Uncharacterized protein n=1 Tax=Xaviernesmea rhizosphaerae TaxID=1672749 RepID=A0A1Q9AMM8_9HYPH|nr:hypothetical protein [Xaviernesmea rhizosphaerae]OLP56634.1 hypothetical protein BJF92_11115 [Xaviernesmea rhizosphaerae]OQP88362.1 hypothetical protein BTR14_02720 [Xaviernesmea rhizosphaerae]
MNMEHLTQIVEVSLKRGNERQDVGIMTVRQALELPVPGRFEYTNPERSSRRGPARISREELQAYAWG